MRTPSAPTDDVKNPRHASSTRRPGRSTAWQVCAALAASLCASAPAIAAIDTSVSLGFSVTASADATPVAFFDLAGATRAGKWVNWRPTASLGILRGRSVRADLDRNLVIGGVGARLVDWWRNAFIGLEVGYADRTTAAVSSHVQFISSLGWQGENHVVMLRHISNGDLAGGKNLGETMVLLGGTF